MLFVIIISKAMARSSSFTPSRGRSFITNFPKEDATIDPLRFIPSSAVEEKRERELVCEIVREKERERESEIVREKERESEIVREKER